MGETHSNFRNEWVFLAAFSLSFSGDWVRRHHLWGEKYCRASLGDCWAFSCQLDLLLLLLKSPHFLNFLPFSTIIATRISDIYLFHTSLCIILSCETGYVQRWERTAHISSTRYVTKVKEPISPQTSKITGYEWWWASIFSSIVLPSPNNLLIWGGWTLSHWWQKRKGSGERGRAE